MNAIDITKNAIKFQSKYLGLNVKTFGDFTRYHFSVTPVNDIVEASCRERGTRVSVLILVYQQPFVILELLRRNFIDYTCCLWLYYPTSSFENVNIGYLSKLCNVICHEDRCSAKSLAKPKTQTKKGLGAADSSWA